MDNQKTTKILLVSPPPTATGGIARWTKHILNHYDNNKGEVNLELELMAVERSKFIEPTTPFLLRAIYGVKDYVLFINDFRKRLRDTRPALVHIATSASFGLLKDAILQMICKWYDARNVIHFRFGRIPELHKQANWEWQMLKYVTQKSDCCIVLDKVSLDVLRSSGFDQVVSIPNAIDADISILIEKYKDTIRNDRKIVFAGHLLPSKGVMELVKACSQIKNMELVMLGKIPSDEIRNELLNIAQTKGETDWLHLEGNKPYEDVIKELMSAQIFVLPSYTEGFPNSILEAMACACAVVATTVGAIPEMLNIEDEACGICVEARNVEALKYAIQQCLDNKELSHNFGHRAQQRVMNEYSMPSIWTKLTNIWQGVITNKK